MPGSAIPFASRGRHCVVDFPISAYGRTVLANISFVVAVLLAAAPVSSGDIIDLTVHPTVSRTVSRGATRVPVLEITVRRSCGSSREAITLPPLTLMHRGLGRLEDIARVYALQDGVRISSPAAIARDGSIDLRFRGIPLVPCSTLDLQIAVDYAETADIAGEHRWSLAPEHPIGIPGVVVRVAPEGLRESLLQTSPTIESSLSVTDLPLTRRVRFGENRTLARLQLTNDSDRDLRVVRILLTNDGSARDSDVRNLRLTDSRGKQVSSIATQMQGDRIDLTVVDLTIARGTSRIIELHADVHASRRRTLRFLIEEPSDITALPTQRR